MDWLNAAVLFLLVAGHTELLVTLTNRSHALPLREQPLKHLRHIHDVLIPAFPIVLVWFVGLRGPKLLLVGAHWSDLPWGWCLYLSVCAGGAVSLGVHVVRRMRRPKPIVQLSNDSWTINVARQLGDRPLGNGPFRFLTHVPGNEIFKLEVSEKTYRLPRLPREWDGLSILHLTDLHYIGTVDRTFFERVMDLSEDLNCDLIALTGDLLDDLRLVDWLPATLGRLKAPLGCFYVLGNHDWYLKPDEIRKWLQELGWKGVAGRCLVREHKGHSLAIGGSERPWMGTHPDFSSVPSGAFRLLLSHTPDNIRWAQEQNVDLMLSGHNHGGQVLLPWIGPVYSPSLFGCRYASGVFWEDPTLLYVGRGISGRHPLRLGCKPELTKVVLKAP